MSIIYGVRGPDGHVERRDRDSHDYDLWSASQDVRRLGEGYAVVEAEVTWTEVPLED